MCFVVLVFLLTMTPLSFCTALGLPAEKSVGANDADFRFVALAPVGGLEASLCRTATALGERRRSAAMYVNAYVRIGRSFNANTTLTLESSGPPLHRVPYVCVLLPVVLP